MSVSTIEKLAIIMHRHQIDFNEFNLKLENVETMEFIDILQDENTSSSIRLGGFRVGDTVGSLLYIW